MKKIHFINRIFTVILFTFLFSCKEDTVNKESKKEEIISFLKTPPKEDITYHEDTTKEYEYRTGTSGEYTYNYNAYGYDNDGNEVTENIAVEGKYGNGILTKANGDEIDIKVEWISKGKLLTKDEDGNEYELYVDED